MRFSLLIPIILYFAIQPLSGEDCGLAITGFDQEIKLEGNWFHRKGDNPDWKDPMLDDSGWSRKQVPDFAKDKETKVVGFHWYRCKIGISESIRDWNEPIAIRFGDIRDVDEVYFNGIQIGSSGQTAPVLSVDMQKDRIYSIPRKLILPGGNLIAVRIYSATNYAGLQFAPRIGNEFSLIRKSNNKDIAPVICGYIFILMGLYYIIASVVKSTNKGNLFFSLFSITLGLYTLLRSQYRYRMFDEFVTSFRLELALLTFLPVLFLNFLYFYLNKKRDIALFVEENLMGCLLIYILFSKTVGQWIFIIDLYNYLLIYPLVLAIRTIATNRKTYKKKTDYLFAGFIILTPAILVDALTAMNLIRLPGMTYLGFMVFLIVISVQLSDDMVESLRKFQDQEKDLIKMEKVKTDFLINISIEFHYYMENMEKIFTDFFQSETKGKSSKSRLDDLHKYVDLSLSIFKDAITLKTIEDKSFTPIIKKFLVKDIIDECISLVETRLDETRKNKIISVTPPNYETVNCRKLFFLIVYHLIENAYKYTKKTDKIQIVFRATPDSIELIVTDEGPGISRDLQENIFKKFVRGGGYSADENISTGIGIGLTLVRRAAEYLGGTIELQSSSGLGSSFIVRLPFKAAQ